MAEDVLLVCSTFPEIETARRIAQQLVTENLAACDNQLVSTATINAGRNVLVLESLIVFSMLCIASFFVFLYQMDRKNRRKEAGADAKGRDS